MRILARCVATLVLLAPLALAACHSDSSPSSTQPVVLAVAADSPIVDVPVPASFYMVDPSHSEVTPGTNFRWVNHNYKGKASYVGVVRFYREQLPTKGWNCLSQTQADESVTLTFSKNNEDCVVTIWTGTIHTHININLHPTGRAAGTR